MATTIHDKSLQRLISYSAAAGLGAFAFGQAAGASVIFTDVNPDATLAPSESLDINLDNTGYPEVPIVLTSGSNNNVQVRDAYAGNVLSDIENGSNYYVRGFDQGDLIGDPTITDEADDTGAHLAAGNYNFFDGDQKYAGVKFDLSDGTHFGYVRLQISDQNDGYHATVRSYAYQSTPDTPIEAGAQPVPEPGSLALLAAGAGALAVRRRRRSA